MYSRALVNVNLEHSFEVYFGSVCISRSSHCCRPYVGLASLTGISSLSMPLVGTASLNILNWYHFKTTHSPTPLSSVEPMERLSIAPPGLSGLVSLNSY